jgi:hypothetical protein
MRLIIARDVNFFQSGVAEKAAGAWGCGWGRKARNVLPLGHLAFNILKYIIIYCLAPALHDGSRNNPKEVLPCLWLSITI